MAFLSNFTYDLFVSYAGVNDWPINGSDEGWITTLVNKLIQRLEQKLECQLEVSMWADPHSPAHTPLSVTGKNFRLTQEIREFQEQWSLLGKKLSKLRTEKALETRVEEKMRLEHQISGILQERQTITNTLEALEAQVVSETLPTRKTTASSRSLDIVEASQALKDSAILLIILSREYLHSAWCQAEKERFLQAVQERLQEGLRVFVVKQAQLEGPHSFREFDAISSYRYDFWVMEHGSPLPRVLMPDSLHDALFYNNQLTELGRDMTDELEKLQRRQQYVAPLQKPPNVIVTRQPTVFLADVTDDLYAVRQNVAQHLAQAQITVFPREPYYSYEAHAFQQAVRADLEKSDVFVQLLGTFPGRPLKDLPQGHVRCQYELAQELDKPIFQWRPPQLALDTVYDPGYQAFLQTDTVQAVALETFQRNVLEALRPQDKPPQHAPSGAHIGLLLFIDADTQKDAELVERVCQVFKQFDVGYVLPLQSHEPAENREAFEQYVLNCDAMVIIYGGVSVKWVSDQLLAVRKIFWKREQPLHAFAVFDGPPEDKPPLTLRLPNMRILECRDCVSEEKLLDFINSIQMKG